jgi:coenzyme F420-dependent glucose-6-phosphate dehydrogenase
MGIVESVRAVMWARKRQPDQVAYGVALGHERFGPRELLDQAVAAERAGFDLVCCSDHLAPWWEPAQGTPGRAGAVLQVAGLPGGVPAGDGDRAGRGGVGWARPS